MSRRYPRPADVTFVERDGRVAIRTCPDGRPRAGILVEVWLLDADDRTLVYTNTLDALLWR